MKVNRIGITIKKYVQKSDITSQTAGYTQKSNVHNPILALGTDF